MKCEKPSILIVKQFREKTGPCLQCSTSIPKGLLRFYQEVQTNSYARSKMEQKGEKGQCMV